MKQPVKPKILAESRLLYGIKTYISLFSSAGIGCYGFKQENFYCIATVELLERRLKIQSYNEKCFYPSGYIGGDIRTECVKDKIFKELKLWEKWYNVKDLDVLIATPPCQGMSVANHKKKDELQRNSLVVESIKLTKTIKPKFFIFENVRAFLNSICTDTDGKDRQIRQAIDRNLSGDYNIHNQVLNFKDYGNPSSRTRTLVIGVRKDLNEVTPLDFLPDIQPEKTLKQVIGHLPPLMKMGEISKNDIYHSFRKYSPNMEDWICDIKEGQSAFDNIDPLKIPHSIKNGKIVYNAKKNGDKYTRQYWDKVPPCIHTRNDILASQNTIHPIDNRVFSIRELMIMMSIPNSFKWTDIPLSKLNAMSEKEKQAFIKKEDINIRQNIGEAVPTIIFQQIAKKIHTALCKNEMSDQEIQSIIQTNNLTEHDSLINFISNNKDLGFVLLSKIAELANAQREENAAFYTRQDICFTIIKNLPYAKDYTTLNILEPSVGVGNFIPLLIKKYQSVQSVTIDVVDIDIKTIELVQLLVTLLSIPPNITISFINDDFLLHSFDKKYDIVIGNPPYKKITNEKELLRKYKSQINNTATNNIFAFFIEKAISLGNEVSLIVPKSLINAPEFNKTRSQMNSLNIKHIIDFGEKGFKGVKIETICFIINTSHKASTTTVESYITNNIKSYSQKYITDPYFPYWLLYRDDVFDSISQKMHLNIFKAFRDRSITKKITKDSGNIRVLKSRNIGDNTIIDIPGYDCYMDNIDGNEVAKFLNKDNCVLVPNLSYHPRGCFLPKNCIVDGSVAILTLIDKSINITEKDLAFFATDEFTKFYAIARNYGTRSLNIDNNSVFFFGKLKH